MTREDADILISRAGGSGEHEITLFSPPNLKILFQFYRARFVAFRWDAANDQPTLHIMSAEGANALRVSYHFDDPKDFSSTEIGPLSLFIERNDIKSQSEAVYFDCTNVHSSFPEWAYDSLNKAFSEKVGSTQSIDCDQVTLLNLPTFTFHYEEKLGHWCCTCQDSRNRVPIVKSEKVPDWLLSIFVVESNR
ncbi:unnamed protein product [Albugo candida]|uniref:Uncharacterized protein n=1 Tax=Albugo candida TaxID=65357 RepID=A0A024GEP6_9STRA|nr:unnamed protein product [Albugo candida]|eukprot:CCI44807.1 unnamed protein product [Albugo candida]